MMAVMPTSIYSGSPESTPLKKPPIQIFKISDQQPLTYPEIFSDDDMYKPPIDSTTTNTSSFNEEEVSWKN